MIRIHPSLKSPALPSFPNCKGQALPLSHLDKAHNDHYTYSRCYHWMCHGSNSCATMEVRCPPFLPHQVDQSQKDRTKAFRKLSLQTHSCQGARLGLCSGPRPSQPNTGFCASTFHRFSARVLDASWDPTPLPSPLSYTLYPASSQTIQGSQSGQWRRTQDPNNPNPKFGPQLNAFCKSVNSQPRLYVSCRRPNPAPILCQGLA